MKINSEQNSCKLKNTFFQNLKITSEAVASGHPDKICDQIADLILEEYLKHDPNARVACEVFASDHLIVVGGEISSTHEVNIEQKVRHILKRNNYSINNFKIISKIKRQSLELNAIVSKAHRFNVGDQCITVGFASNETKNCMPIGFMLAQELAKKIEELSKKDKSIKSDAKTEVTMSYLNNGQFLIDTMLVSVQHDADVNLEILTNKVITEVMEPIARKYKLNLDFKKIVNPGGTFITGGLESDTGLTGRKLMVDTYGLYARNGGGAFSGKDPTKIDRTGSYYARWIAKHVVVSGLANVCEVQLGWRIGTNTPISVTVDCFGTNKIELKKIQNIIKEQFKFTFNDIIKLFALQKCNYSALSVYGHFGRNQNKFLWEKLDKAIIKRMQNIKTI